MVALILAVAYFAAVCLGDNVKLKVLIQRAYLVSKRFFGIPTFFNYAIADGLYNLLLSDRAGIKNIQKAEKPEFQLCFSFWEQSGWNEKVRKLHKKGYENSCYCFTDVGPLW
jgi:hypothetical protein